jgi:serine/threonine protein kinase
MWYGRSQSTIHCNLNSGTVLLDWHWNIKLRVSGAAGDLGRIANARYTAPDCFENTRVFKSDVFSFGMILCELIVGHCPFANLRISAVWRRIAISDFCDLDDFCDFEVSLINFCLLNFQA